MQGTELGKAIGEGEWGVCGGFEGVVEVQGDCIDQGEGVDRHMKRRSPRSTYHRGWSNLNGLTADEVIALYQNWRHCDCDYVRWLLGVEVSDREARWLEVALTVVGVDGRERYLALDMNDQTKGEGLKTNARRTDPAYFPPSAKTGSPPLNFFAGGKPPEE